MSWGSAQHQIAHRTARQPGVLSGSRQKIDDGGERRCFQVDLYPVYLLSTRGDKLQVTS